MSCNTLYDKRLEFKTNLPKTVGDFWLSQGTETAKNIVRVFTRLSLQNNALKYIDYAESLMSVTTAHINALPTYFRINELNKEFRNFTESNYSTTAHNGFPITSEIPLRKQDQKREGVYLLDPETRRIWQDASGQYWIWAMDKDPEDIINPYSSELIVMDTVYMLKQPEYAVEISGIIPTMILSKKGYLLYGLDFRVESSYIIFSEPLADLFDEYIHIQAGYEKRKTLFGFPFSIDPETPGVEHISKFLRNNSSAKNLEKALSQVVGYTSVPKFSVVIKKEIPDGTVLIDETGNLITTIQDYQVLEQYEKDDFPGKPITVLSGEDPGIIDFINTNSVFTLTSPVGIFTLRDSDYICTINIEPKYPLSEENINFVEVNLGDINNSLYFNSLRRNIERIDRYDQNNVILPTFSQYLIDKYGPEEYESGDTFYAPILKEFIHLFGQSILFIAFSPNLNLEQRQAAIDFLQTHTPVNAIILTDTIWE